MRVKEITKKEIEDRFLEMSDYMKIEYLSSCLKNQIDFDTRKFVLVKLSGLYETKGMFLDAAKAMKSAAEINTTKRGKVNDFVKAAELFVRGGDFDMVDIVVKKSFALTEWAEAWEVEEKIKSFYRIQGKVSTERNKRKQAIGIYEKLLGMSKDEEKEWVEGKLLELYEGVGEMNKFRSLKRRAYGSN